MTTRAEWVIGRGLLGSAVLRQLPSDAIARSVRWADRAQARVDLAAGIDALRASDADRLVVYWCAGRGVTSSPQSVFDAELATFSDFLELLGNLPAADRDRLTVFLSSSVGGAYGGATGSPFSEVSPTRAGSAYGVAKLAMESGLTEATRTGGWRSFIARLTNLYGPGQDLSKGQGLLSVIAAGYVTHTPVGIYVSLDTLRDYVYEDDCARVVVAGAHRAGGEPAGSTVTKIVGSMAAQSIGASLAEAKRLRGRPAPVILGQRHGTGQASDLRVRSQVWKDLDTLVSTTLPEGLDKLYRAQLAAQAQGTARR